MRTNVGVQIRTSQGFLKVKNIKLFFQRKQNFYRPPLIRIFFSLSKVDAYLKEDSSHFKKLPSFKLTFANDSVMSILQRTKVKSK